MLIQKLEKERPAIWMVILLSLFLLWSLHHMLIVSRFHLQIDYCCLDGRTGSVIC